MIVRLLDAQAAKSPAESPLPAPKPPVISTTGEQTPEGLLLAADAVTASTPQTTNSLGEQQCTTTLSLTLQNTTHAPLTISSEQLYIAAVYSQNGQRREAPVLVDPFTVTVPAGSTLQQPVTLHTILPTSLAAQLTLGQQLTGYDVHWQTGAQTTSLPSLAAVLSAAVR